MRSRWCCSRSSFCISRKLICIRSSLWVFLMTEHFDVFQLKDTSLFLASYFLCDHWEGISLFRDHHHHLHWVNDWSFSTFSVVLQSFPGKEVGLCHVSYCIFFLSWSFSFWRELSNDCSDRDDDHDEQDCGWKREGLTKEKKKKHFLWIFDQVNGYCRYFCLILETKWSPCVASLLIFPPRR